LIIKIIKKKKKIIYFLINLVKNGFIFILVLTIFNTVKCNENSENELELQNLLFKQLNSRIVPTKELNTVLFRLFGHSKCDAQVLQPNTKLKHLKSMATCFNCRLAINEKGHIHAVKELNYESN
jgi:hypothetical protein